MLVPVILAGGSGTRLWPLSRSHYAKQFISLYDDLSLLQHTIKRAETLTSCPPVFITNHQHRFLLADQLAQLGCQPSAIILEPEGKNTAPAITLAALFAQQNWQTSTLFVMPADHHLQHVELLCEHVHQAKTLSAQQHITFGIRPSYAETGYGYIKQGTSISESTLFNVASFKEKPDLATANQYLASGDYLWNSGMFLFNTEFLLNELAHFQPALLSHCEAAFSRRYDDLDFIRIDPESFSECNAISIDYALLEKTNNALVMPLNIPWSDVGGFNAIWQLGKKDEHNNHIQGSATHIDSHNNLVITKHQHIALLGINDLCVIAEHDALLIAKQTQLEHLPALIAKLKTEQPQLLSSHTYVHRPWGYYQELEAGPNFKVKRIAVKPGASLSLQSHQHRAEHWVVVQGEAEVTIGNRVSRVQPNQSVFIAKQQLHRLSNPLDYELQLIEIQTGDYISEDDITRFEDNWNRTN